MSMPTTEPEPQDESQRSLQASPQGSGSQGGIPEAPEGNPYLAADPQEADQGPGPDSGPRMDFWEALYGRRSIRKFKPDPVPRALVEQVMHAGVWAPSSCNYQMWDLVCVDDPETNARLTELSTQMGNAPVNIVVSYGRDFSEEQWANIQSASALIQNMSLAAHVLGLGTFWITQMGHREKVREAVGLPLDRLVVAVLALGWPAKVPSRGPKRRPLREVTHWNHYAGRPIPSSADPSVWTPEDLTTYQRARVLNGLRWNKPRAWELRALEEMLERFVPPASSAAPASASLPANAAPPANASHMEQEDHHQSAAPRWLDVLPCTGILFDRIARDRRGYQFDIVERSPEVAAFCAARARPRAGEFLWSPASSPGDGSGHTHSPPADAYDLVSCLFRLENLRPEDRATLLGRIARWVRPGGRVILGFVSQRSFHDWTERLRARRGGPRGVEYVLSPDPNIGPFETLDPVSVIELARAAGLEPEDRFGAQSVPAREEIEFRTRNFSARSQKIARVVGQALERFDALPGFASARGRFQYVKLVRR